MHALSGSLQSQEPAKPEVARKPYQFLHVNVLREYLAMELRVDTPFPFDPERAYDDFGVGPLLSSCMSLCSLKGPGTKLFAALMLCCHWHVSGKL